MPDRPPPLLNWPNALSLSRLPLAALLAACIAAGKWGAALGVFALAMLTDWADGFVARRVGPLTALGRSLDPLTDKVLIGTALVYLATLPQTGVGPAVVALMLGRELWVTGLRGAVETQGHRFGADWFGKLKTATQTAALLGVFALEALRGELGEWLAAAELGRSALVWLMLLATLGSGAQYTARAVVLLKRPIRVPHA